MTITTMEDVRHSATLASDTVYDVYSFMIGGRRVTGHISTSDIKLTYICLTPLASTPSVTRAVHGVCVAAWPIL